MHPEPFKIAIPDADIARLRQRLRDAIWPGDFNNETGRYGLNEAWLRTAVGYWRDEFDWRKAEAEMNRLPHYRVVIDDVPIHYIHLRSKRKNATPLIITHGWPWSFWDWKDVIEPLANPDSDSLPAFDVVVPSLPGFTFSTPLRTPGIDMHEVARRWRTLMQDVLGYGRFAAAGGDWGSLVSAQLGHEFPEDLTGVHLTLPLMPGIALEQLEGVQFLPEEQWMADRIVEARPLIVSHMTVHTTDPQTLAYGLADSPIGLAAWLWERRLAWSDSRYENPARQLPWLCTLASLYWFTNCIGSSLRIYAEHFSRPWAAARKGKQTIDVPTGFVIAPKELAMMPRQMAAAHCNLARWTVAPRGGHFIPAEAPDVVVREYQAFFGKLA